MEKVRGVQLSFLVDTSSFSIQLCTWTQTALSPKKVRALNFESYSTPENFFPVNTGVQYKQTFFGRLAVWVHRMVCQGRKKCLDAEGWWPVFPLSHLPKTQRRGKLKTPRKSNVWDFFFSD